MAEWVFWGLSALVVIGALVVILCRDIMRMVLALATFLLSTAGFFLFYGMAFLAAAQVFVYVGGVLVLVLFAVMVVRRTEAGRPLLESRHDLSAAVISVGLFALLVRMLGPSAPEVSEVSIPETSLAELTEILLGPMLPHLELIGVLLLIALVAAVAVIGREERS